MAAVKRTKKRKAEFDKATFKPAQIKDSRFGIRRIFLNEKEKPQTFSYADPAPSWWGTR
jgi:hypothetical protein